MDNNYTPEMRAADIEIAKAMWKHGNFVALGTMGDTPQVAEFHADHAARYALLVWLGADNGRWYRYVQILLSDVTQPSAMRQIATAPAHEVAEAALKVIKEMEL